MKAIAKHLPGRRLELSLTAVLVGGVLFVVWLNRESGASGPTVVVATLELLLPLGLAITAAGLLADDPTLDLLLTVAQPAPRTLAQRLGIVLGCGLILCLTVLGFATLWEIPLPIRGVRRVGIWAAPSLFLTGVATVSPLVRGRMLDGLTTVLGIWGAMLLTVPLVGNACALGTVPSCAAMLLSPVMTMVRPVDPYWPLNRLIWSGLGILLLGIGLLLARDEERLVEASRAE